VKTFKAKCELRGAEATFQVHVGRPAPGFHPLKYQAAWLREMHRGEIDPEVMEEVEVLLEKALAEGVGLEDVIEEELHTEEPV
jgi:hypothetical protein